MTRDDVLQFLSNLGNAFLDIIYPEGVACLICGSRERELDEVFDICTSCNDTMPFIHNPWCSICGKPLYNSKDTKCEDCENFTHQFNQGISVFDYTHSARNLIHRFKYKGERSLARPMGIWMERRIREKSNWDMDIIIPVPLHPSREKQRGFNQSALLGSIISEGLGINLDTKALTREKYTHSQTTLDRGERFKNLKDAFKVADPSAIEGKNILLVDDVYTTGATANWCSSVLREAGAGNIYVVTFAAGSNIKTRYNQPL